MPDVASERFPWDASLPRRTVDLDSGTVTYTETGRGAPVIFIHGYGDELFTWRHQLRGLRDSAHLYALDLIGYGFSAKPSIAYTPEVFMQCVQQFMRAVRIARASLVGSSMGAVTALGLAKHHPHLVDRLALIGPTTPGVQPAGRFLYLVFWLVHHGRLGEMLLQPTSKAAVRMALRDTVADPSLITAEVVQYYCRLVRQPGFKHVYVSTARNWHGWAAHRPRLGELQMPVLLIWGEQDRVHPIRQAGLLQTLIPQAQLIRLPGCGHQPQSERPEEVNAALRTFLAAASGSDRPRD